MAQVAGEYANRVHVQYKLSAHGAWTTHTVAPGARAIIINLLFESVHLCLWSHRVQMNKNLSKTIRTSLYPEAGRPPVRARSSSLADPGRPAGRPELHPPAARAPEPMTASGHVVAEPAPPITADGEMACY